MKNITYDIGIPQVSLYITFSHGRKHGGVMHYARKKSENWLY